MSGGSRIGCGPKSRAGADCRRVPDRKFKIKISSRSAAQKVAARVLEPPLIVNDIGHRGLNGQNVNYGKNGKQGYDINSRKNRIFFQIHSFSYAPKRLKKHLGAYYTNNR